MTTDSTTEAISRRALGGLAAAGVGLPLLAACGSDDSGSATDAGSGGGSSESSSPSSSSSDTAAAGGGDALTSTGDIEVGGGTIFADQEVVVTQPTEGDFKCFTAVCTHTGCIVGSVEDGTINCPCHGSKYAVADGSVTDGPAPAPLPPKQIKVQGTQITLA